MKVPGILLAGALAVGMSSSAFAFEGNTYYPAAAYYGAPMFGGPTYAQATAPVRHVSPRHHYRHHARYRPYHRHYARYVAPRAYLPLGVRAQAVVRHPGPYDVYWRGDFIGRDPDPNVRLEMIRNAISGGG